MSLFDVAGDARRAFDVLRAGGVAIVPHNIGYSILGGSNAALRKIFVTKGRGATKRNAMVGNFATHSELHVCSTRGREIVRAIVDDYGLPLGCIAPFRSDHPMMMRLDGETLDGSTENGTVVILLNAGRFHAELTRLGHEFQFPLFGSSANKTLSGTKFKVEEIEREIVGIADIVVDHGLQPFHPYRSSSTLLNVETLEVVRFGSCYPDIAYVLRRHFGIELPAPPASALGDR
jgi:tRNA A37 threonylcarbamoyladenosine synthetase subunit TsaC/SUA5/YrdC